jgi:hypothetical protein
VSSRENCQDSHGETSPLVPGQRAQGGVCGTGGRIAAEIRVAGEVDQEALQAVPGHPRHHQDAVAESAPVGGDQEEHAEKNCGAEQVVEPGGVIGTASDAALAQTLERVVLWCKVVARLDQKAEEEIGPGTEVLDDEEVADPADNRSDRQARRSEVHMGEDVQSQHPHPPTAGDDPSCKATHDREIREGFEGIQETLVEVSRDGQQSGSKDRSDQTPREYGGDLLLVEASILGLAQHEPCADHKADAGHHSMQ